MLDSANTQYISLENLAIHITNQINDDLAQDSSDTKLVDDVIADYKVNANNSR